MKHQQVNVDYWSMGKAMLMYGALTALCWLMLRLFNTVFTLPRRLRSQQENIQNTLQELQKRFPDLDITEEDLLNADKELEKLLKEDEDEKTKENSVPKIQEPPSEEDKKSI
ncbi:hypothetical protein RR48_02382 [Papilio machaon]|uniref:Uncharacterized protein n=1 Tax=Papilio machaon TaxID=76193 RepID=A0A0N1IJK3_PAPMA|nr:uncharacterized protein LOC106719630 [Papilio machaon]KPJ19311.1 hypothetical protein RR48_02382 [Papilio machaon]